MEFAAPLTKEDHQQFKAARAKKFEKMSAASMTYGHAIATHPIFAETDQTAFFAHIKSLQNDLEAHANILLAMWKTHRNLGEPMAPHYAKRIAIILRRDGDKAAEKRFLTAWCKHFDGRDGSVYGELASRLAKL